MTLARFELRLAMRRGSLAAAAVLFAALAAGATVLGLGSFRQLGLGSVSPAAATLLNLAILFPSAYALVSGSVSLQSDRDGGLLAMLRAARLGGGAIALAKLVSVVVPTWLVIAAGTGAVALVLSGSVALADLGAFAAVVAVSLVVPAAASAVGVLVAAIVHGRQQASTAGIAIWFVLAVGVDLLAIALTPLLRTGTAGVLLVSLVDPLESGRILGLLALGADAQVLGPFGGSLRESLGTPFAVAMLAGAQLAWTAAATAAAARILVRS